MVRPTFSLNRSINLNWASGTTSTMRSHYLLSIGADGVYYTRLRLLLMLFWDFSTHWHNFILRCSTKNNTNFVSITICKQSDSTIKYWIRQYIPPRFCAGVWGVRRSVGPVTPRYSNVCLVTLWQMGICSQLQPSITPTKQTLILSLNCIFYFNDQQHLCAWDGSNILVNLG